MSQPFRTAAGGQVERGQTLNFTFDGRALTGCAGDTLASALLANGVHLVGRSFKYHRPRGIYSAGPEEPNALIALGPTDAHTPNLRATEIELFEGLEARSQNRWPSLAHDVGAIVNAAAPLIPAGFYYKTFMWPADRWPTYEKHIRRAAGLGAAPAAMARSAEEGAYDRRFAHCDVLVAGGGAAGLAAALTAARAGARVIVADERPAWGGMLTAAPATIDGADGAAWVTATVAELAARDNVTLLLRASVFGRYDQDLYAIAVRRPDGPVYGAAPRETLWLARTRRAVVATGAIERPLVFANNDRPGVMLAGAAQAYVNRYGVMPGRRAVVATTNDSAYAVARDLQAAGVAVAAIVDARMAPPPDAAIDGVRMIAGSAVVAARGRGRVRGAAVARLSDDGQALAGAVQAIDCDLLCVSGGWSPAVHLYSHAGGKLRYDAAATALVPRDTLATLRVVGAAAGQFALDRCLADGVAAGSMAAAECGHGATAVDVPAAASVTATPPRALWQVPLARGHTGKRFVDLQDDVTVADVALAVREGYRSVEHLKRYTTLGMGTDQGKTSNVNGLAILATALDDSIDAVGTTTFRPPTSPVTLGTFAGRETGQHFTPIRRTPLHDRHAAAGAVFTPAGLWLRPYYYPRDGEDVRAASRREAAAVRHGVGLVDVSTLGRIDIQGPDAAELLNRLYVNGWSTLAVGKVRYGLMLREDGMVFDDGTTARLADDHYVMTTTTANAGPVMAHVEYHLQVVWPELDAAVASITDQWAVIAVAGPHSRATLQQLAGDIDLANAALPFMGLARGTLAGMPAIVFRISFSGELAYEVAVPADYGPGMWDALMAAGAAFDVVPYGTEALGILRIEKGHFVIGAEADGRMTADDLGLGRMQSTKKDFIGRRSLSRPALTAPGRQQFVGLVPADGAAAIPSGAQILTEPRLTGPAPMIGHVTSTAYCAERDGAVALAVVADGRARMGERVYASSPLTDTVVAVTITDPVFVDPDGERLRG